LRRDITDVPSNQRSPLLCTDRADAVSLLSSSPSLQAAQLNTLILYGSRSYSVWYWLQLSTCVVLQHSMAFKWDDLKAEIERQEKRKTERRDKQRAKRQTQQNVQQHTDPEDDERLDAKDEELPEDEEQRMLEQIRRDLAKARALQEEASNMFAETRADWNSVSDPEQFESTHKRFSAVMDKSEAAMKLKQSIVARQVAYHKKKRSQNLSVLRELLRAPPEAGSLRISSQMVGRFARGELMFARWRMRYAITETLANRTLRTLVVMLRWADRMRPR